MDLNLNQLAKETSHCTHGSLTNNYGLIFQIILASAAFGCLIVKRFLEPLDQRRSWKIWFFDTTKQIIGCLILHFINILTAEISSTDPCTVFLISSILDSSVGLILIYVFIKLILIVAIKFNVPTLEFGFYGDPLPKGIYWLHQTLAYILILLVQKVIIFIILMWHAWNQVRDLILWLFPSKEVEVAMVLFFIPFFVNSFIFWITDNFLTMNSKTSKKVLNFTNSSQSVAKKLANLKNQCKECISTSAKLVNMYDIMFINTKQKLRNEEDDNLVEINLQTIGDNNQPV